MRAPPCRRTPLSLSLALLLLAQAHAQEAPPPASDARHPPGGQDAEHIKEIHGLVVTGNATRDTVATLAKPTETLSGERLDEARAATLGDTLASLPGVQSTNFGPAVGRPILRGMEGPRVNVLTDGMATQDVSTVSQDHAPAVEPFLADRIDLLRGPAALLYGSGSMAGAVNLADGRIPEDAIDNGFSGRAETRFFTGNQHGTTSMARIDGGTDRYALHADAVYRHMPDMRTPLGRQWNAWMQSQSAALGGSLLGDWGYAGLSASRLENAYGNPGEPDVRIKLRQQRVDAKGALRDLWGDGNGLRFGFSHTGYQHTEFEGDTPGTVFRKNANEGRLEASFGHPGGWQGVLGMQAARSDFAALGEEAFLPATRTRNAAAFGLARRTLGALQLDMGGRIEHTTSTPANAASHHATPVSAALAGSWALNAHWKLSANFDHDERAPGEEELFANGPHIATLAYEVGSAQLRKEAANQFELGLHFHSGRVDAKLSAYRNRYRDFIHLADTGTTWHWDAEDRDLPVLAWAQRDARFRGLEAEVSMHLAENDSGDWDVRVFGDRVRATFTDGSNLPRIAPARIGSQLRWSHAGWRASLGATRTQQQADVALNETPTAGYTLMDAHLTRHFDTGNLGWEVFADGSNLTNQLARVHTSFLKDAVALPGRSVAFGVRVFF